MNKKNRTIWGLNLLKYALTPWRFVFGPMDLTVKWSKTIYPTFPYDPEKHAYRGETDVVFSNFELGCSLKKQPFRLAPEHDIIRKERIARIPNHVTVTFSEKP